MIAGAGRSLRPFLGRAARESGLLLAALCLLSCSTPHLQDFTIPKREPRVDRSGSPGRGRLTLHASTNCAEIGDVVTWTLTVANEDTYPLTLIGTPPIDMVLGPEPQQRWSATDQFPGTIDPVLQPGEARVYQWRWVADAAYGQSHENPGAGVRVHIGVTSPRNPLPHGNEVGVGIGVKYLRQGQARYRCSELR